MLRSLKLFLKSRDGSVATTIGVMAVPLMLCCGVALDYSSLHNARENLQEAADSAALASARELGLVSAKDETVKTVANDYALANIHQALGQKQGLQSSDIKTTISQSRKEVTVDISYTWTPMIIQYFDSSALPIKVSSTASLAGEQSICVLTLDETGSHAIDMGGEATLTANDCVIYSNSKDTRGISVFRKSQINGSEIMSSGGYDGPFASFNPLPITDTPKVDDPLKDRPQPSVGPCDYTRISVQKDTTLKPGIYCGGLDIGGKAVARLTPGDYIIRMAHCLSEVIRH